MNCHRDSNSITPVSLVEENPTMFRPHGEQLENVWAPVVHLPQIEDRELREKHDLRVHTAEGVLGVVLSGARQCSPRINDYLNRAYPELRLSVGLPEEGRCSLASCHPNSGHIRLDWVVVRRLLGREGGRGAIVGLWAHELGHALTVPPVLSEMFDFHSISNRVRAQNEVKNVLESSAEEMARALGFENHLQQRDELVSEIREAVEIERGFLE